MLCFTMEEIWLNRFPSETDSVHLHTVPDTPADWQDADLASKWAAIRRVRRVVNGAIEPHRSAKDIGSSLEAAPTVYIADEATRAAMASVDAADMCITSALTISADPAPADAFTLDEVEGVAVVFAKAEGEKCARCWKILPDVGTHKHEGVCSRCDSAI
jgi:isoleucyl-tRNA synthetase